ncbi:hypothetical protein CBL_07211 [Carabus blaptoides fortunei]
MSSALKPALPPAASGQTSPGNVTTAAGKAVMSGTQGITQHSASVASYPSGPLGHVPQNLTGLPHAHGNIGMSATNSTNMAANITVNAVPNMSQLGSHPAVNQGTPLNVPGPTKAAGGGGTGIGAALPPSSSVPTSTGTTAATMPHGRPTAHPYLSSVTATPASASATHPVRDEEGTTLPASQNSAQLMAVHKAQQNQQPQHHHPQQSQQSPQQPHHNDQQSQNITDRFKQNQQQQQTPQQQQQAAQSNGTMSGPADATCNKTTVPTPPATADAKTESSPQTAIPPVQNHVPTPSSTVTHEQNNTKQPVDATTPTSTAVPPPATPTSASSELKPTPAAVIPPPAAEPAAEPSQNVATTPTKAAVVPKETPKTPSTLKLATTPRTTNRKRETKMTKTSESPKGNATSSVRTTDGRSPGAQNNKPPDRTPKNARTVSDEDRKSKRTRTRTQPYQSPLPELALISKLSSAGSSSPSKAHDEKLIVFYKNEFLAVRNAEGGFYVCQAVQNVYKSSPRIRIRWLSQDKQDKIYIPDFYDFTDFDCILTNINMERVEKGKYNLPKDELERTENILKRALAVESGGSAPSLTEEHPDGLDLSLFRDESQLKKKRKSAKRKSSEPLSTSSGDMNNSRTRKTPDKVKIRKVSKSPATKSTTIKRNNQQAQLDRRTTVNATSTGGNNEKKDGAGRTSRRSDSGRAERAKRRNESTGSTTSKTSSVVDTKKARVLAKVALKTAIPPAAVVAAAQNKKKVGRTAPATKAPTGACIQYIGCDDSDNGCIISPVHPSGEEDQEVRRVRLVSACTRAPRPP